MTVSREWYLAQTKVRQESVARQNLERQRYIVWLPQVYVSKARRECIEALFPGYLFIRLSPDTDDFGPIRSTVGVLRLVKFGTTFARVSDSWVDEIRAGAVGFPKSAERAARDIREGAGTVALYLNALSPDDVFRVTGAGEVMPQKSTFFYPKIPTGMLFRGHEAPG